MSADIYNKIDEIPGEQGFWKNSTQSAYYRAADWLLGRGVPENDIVDLLNTLYHATAEEYGG
jgi:hypothetical protein